MSKAWCGSWRALGLVVLALAALPATAATLEFVEPADETVRGNVPIFVDLGPGNEGGYVTFYTGEASKPLKFAIATLANKEGLFGYVWETQSQQTNVTDGEYRILAIGYNAAGEVIGQAAKTIEVQNKVPTSQLPSAGIVLRYNLTPGRETMYQAKTETLEVAGGPGAEAADVSMFRGGAQAHWMTRVLRREADGTATVRNSVYSYSEVTSRGGRRALPASGRFVTYGVRGDGFATPHKERTEFNFPYAELAIDFPSKPVKIGDSWRSRMRVLVDPRTGRIDTVSATHTLASVQWYAGFRCAMIESTFDCGPYRVVLNGEDQAGEAWLAAVTLLVRQGKRQTYFAYQPEVGRVLRIDEIQDQRFTLELADEPEPQEAGAGGEITGAGYGGGPVAGPPRGGLPGAGVAGKPGVAAAAPAQETKDKPAGFAKGGPGLKPVTPKGGGGPAKATTEQEPIPFIIINFNRKMHTEIAQAYLEAGK